MSDKPRGGDHAQADIQTTAALARAQAALSHAGAAVASLAGEVLEAVKAAERREREADRRIADADARIAAAEQRVAELEEHLSPGEQVLRETYRRGYSTGYQRGRTGRPADVERALADPRNVTRLRSAS